MWECDIPSHGLRCWEVLRSKNTCVSSSVELETQTTPCTVVQQSQMLNQKTTLNERLCRRLEEQGSDAFPQCSQSESATKNGTETETVG